jgi:excinuclease ABC subunit C
MIDRLCQFLQGKTTAVTESIRAKLDQAVQDLEFERAAHFRDQLQAIARITEHQKVVSNLAIDQDVLAFAREDGQACVQVFFVRGGKLLGREYFVLEGAEDEKGAEVIAQFVKQFYDEAAYVPPEILLPEDLDEAQIIESWLKSRKGQTVTLRVPRSGQGKELIEMAAENAKVTLTSLKAQWLADETKHLNAVAELQAALELPNPPLRMECYDISNTQGTNSVGAMVVFEKGAAKKSDYRKFKIKTVEGANDVASLQEVLQRRFKRFLAASGRGSVGEQGSGGAGERGGEGERGREGEGETRGRGDAERGGKPKTRRTSKGALISAEKKAEESWKRMPDLVIIDGGRGQLGAAREVLRELGIEGVNLIALAKQEEEIFVPGRPDALRLSRNSEALHLLQRIRDEAHRFGLTYHRSLRAKRGLASQLDAIPGIGPHRRRALLVRFGSLDNIRAASVEELLTVPGMTRHAAQKLKEML